MTITRVSILLPLVFFLSLTSLSLASESSNRPRGFIVYVSKSHKPKLFSSHHEWFSSIVNSLPPSHDHLPQILYTYTPHVSGFSAHLTHDQAEALRQVPGVISIVPDQLRELHTTRTPYFLGLSPGHGLWPSGDYGKDIIIGVLDSGVWPEHPSFSDSGMTDVPASWKGTCETSDAFPASSCNKKLIGARAYSKGFIAGQGAPIDPSKDSDSPRDVNGHGTHTSTTAGGSLVQNASFNGFAQGEARGMAPKARIAAYKICWSGGCADSDILAALTQAIEDGVHVISMSVGPKGSAPEYYKDASAIGTFAAVKHGIIVSCSAGNEGPDPLTLGNTAPWIFTVGASTIDREFRADVVLGNGETLKGFSLYSGEPLGNESYPLVYAGDVGSDLCLAGKLNSSQVAGKIVLCDNGEINRVPKANEVKRAGGVGMINRDASMYTYSGDVYTFPATTVNVYDGTYILYYIRLSLSPPTSKILFRKTVVGNSVIAPKVASFSSRGPNLLTPEILKPDVIAPGVNILAGWTGAVPPTDVDSPVQFWLDSGTSMACPHVSGIAAVLRKAYPNWSVAAIKSALMTTAYNVDNAGDTITDYATSKSSTPFDRGSGHVDPDSALDPGLVYDIDTDDYISFLCAIGYNSTQIALFTGEVEHSNICENYTLGNPGNLNYPSFSVVFKTAVVKYKRTVTNVGKYRDVVYNVTVNAPTNVDVNVSPTSLVFSEKYKSLSYEITFTIKNNTLGGSASGYEQSFGSIEWSDGSHVVGSPIAAIWGKKLSVASI